MNARKYELTDERNSAGLYRIRALRDIPEAGVRAGDLGGWIESEANLSQRGAAWVFGSARVSGSAQVFGTARVYGEAEVYGTARVYEAQHVLSGTGLPSGNWTLFRTETAHTLKVGCWDGTTTDLRTLVASTDDWPEARGEQVTQRRPMLVALADMCDAVIATWEAVS